MALPINIDELLHGNTVEWDRIELKKERVVAREYRNRKLGGFLKELKLTEGRGTGLPIIYKSLEVNGSPPPVFETDYDRSYFLSIIKIHPSAQQVNLQKAEEETKDTISSITDINNYVGLLVSHKRDKDKVLIIKALNDIYYYLNLLVSHKRDQDIQQPVYLDFQTLTAINKWIKQYQYNKANEFLSMLKPYIEPKSIKVLEFCKQPRTKDAIFEKIQMYNNTKNYNRHIKPLLEMEWILQTLPEKPNSKRQQYIISETGKIILKNELSLIIRTPVASSNIASVGYDAINKILEIEFVHGGVYQYFDVPKKVYQEFISAAAYGSYFMHNIKNVYEYVKL